MYDLAQFQKCTTSRYECLLQWQQNRSKATMWLLYKNSSYSRVPKTLLLDWRLYVACYYPATPYRLPQHYKRHVCGLFYSCKHQVLWIYLNFEHQFCLNYMGAVHHWQPLWSTTRVCFIDQCWYFNSQWTQEQVTVKASSVGTIWVSWEKCAVTKCLHICWCLWRGLGGGGGTFWLLDESLTFKGPDA